MSTELNEIEAKFISLNMILSIVCIILSIIPSFFMWIFYEIFKNYKYGSVDWQILLIPTVLYIIWVITLFIGNISKNNNEINLLTKYFLAFNTLISTSILIGYAWFLIIFIRVLIR